MVQTIDATTQRIPLLSFPNLPEMMGGNQGTFRIETAMLSDGLHELRVVAVNNSRAESEGIALRQIRVDNRGRSVIASATSITASANQMLEVSVSSTLRIGSVSRIELRHLGRTVGQLNGGSGTVAIDASRLAFGDNQVILIAVFADGEQVSGSQLVVRRTPDTFVAQSASDSGDRTPGNHQASR